MDIHDVRQQNLQQLLDERFDGKQVRLAELIDRQAGYLSRCLSKGKHRKRIGEDFARHIEQSLELESGWMDKTSDLNSEAAGHRADFAARLKEALSSAGIEEWGAGARLAKMAKVTPKAASKWMNGETRPGHEKLVLIAAQLGVRAEWLEYGVGPMSEAAGSSEPRASYGIGEGSNVQEVAPPIQSRRYPIISRVQAGAWTECVAPYEPGDEPQKEVTDYRAQGKAFWLEVKGDSMTAPAGSRPSVPEGTLVLFDTGIDAAPGKLVAALLADSNEATFKQLIEDSGQRYLKALNPAYPLIPINGNCRILGVAVEAKTKF